MILKREDGLTLVELLAVTTMLSLLIMSGMTILGEVTNVTNKQKIELACQETANLIVSDITNELKKGNDFLVKSNNTPKITLQANHGNRPEKEYKAPNNSIKIIIKDELLPFGKEGKNIYQSTGRTNGMGVKNIEISFIDKDSKTIYTRKIFPSSRNYDFSGGNEWW